MRLALFSIVLLFLASAANAQENTTLEETMKQLQADVAEIYAKVNPRTELGITEANVPVYSAPNTNANTNAVIPSGTELFYMAKYPNSDFVKVSAQGGEGVWTQRQDLENAGLAKILEEWGGQAVIPASIDQNP